MKRFLRTTLALPVAALILSACSSLPYYPYKTYGTQSDVRVSENLKNVTLVMCTSQNCFQLQVHGLWTKVPDQGRIRMAYFFQAGGYQSITTCQSGFSFVPRADTRYYLDFTVRSEHCRLNLYRLDASTRVGIALEPSVQRL